MQDATQVKLGSTLSSAKSITDHNADPASFLAGLAVSQSSVQGVPSLLKSAGMRMGVSLGPSLSDSKRLSVCRIGELVPVRLAAKRATGTVTIATFANLLTTTPDSITIGATIFVAQSGAATPGGATFRAATSDAATATSLATQINAHAAASLLVYAVASGAAVTLYAVTAGVGSTGTGNDVVVAYTDNGGGNIGATVSGLSGGKLSGGSATISDVAYATVGAKAYINDVTGEFDIAMSGFSTVSDATYRSGPLTGIDETGASVPAALIDMTGGL